MTPPPHRTIVVPGTGVIVRWPGAVVVIGGGEQAAAKGLAHLTEGHPETPAAGILIERIRSLHSHDLAAAIVTPAGIRLLRHGAGSVGLLDATTVAGSSDSNHPVEFDVEATATPLWVGLGDQPEVDSIGRHLFDLEHGIVPGRGVILDAQAPVVDPTPAPASFELVDLSGAANHERAPLPEADSGPASSDDAAHVDTAPDEVMGIECSRGHFNNPIAAYCQVCGISMVHLTHYLVPGPRPTLGYIVFDSGATYALDQPYLLGREPSPDPASGLRPLVVDDVDHTVSREHAELTFDGWDVVLADLGSTNGTFRWDPATARWERVVPNHPVVIAPGASIAVGRTTFVYETVARSV
ncbi:MAG: FHA domain-containing protein [Acidimicrobiales bacterium]